MVSKENIDEFIEICERIFETCKPKVDKDEARAGVLGYHPLALLVISIDIINQLKKGNK